MELISWHNDENLKATILQRLKDDHASERLVKGHYWENGKGCAVGCTIRGDDHTKYESELGLPVWLARLEDVIFESLPNDDAQKFAINFVDAIPVGKNLDRVKWKFCAFILSENIETVLTLQITDKLKKQVVNATRQCLAMHEASILSGVWDDSASRAAWRAASAAWSAVANAARCAVASAAWRATSAAACAVASAAWCAAESAASAVDNAVASAAESAARCAESAARCAASAAYQRYAVKLLELLREA